MAASLYLVLPWLLPPFSLATLPIVSLFVFLFS
jgi:hypothetical protein